MAPKPLIAAAVGAALIVSAASEAQAQKIYWTDRLNDRIQRADLDGTQVENVLHTPLEGTAPIAVDVLGGKMYWIGTSPSAYRRANLDGSGVEDILLFSQDAPWSLDLDHVRGKVYWVRSNPSRIQRASLDGTAVEDVISAEWLGVPYAYFGPTALDAPGAKMYWVGNIFSSGDKIRRSSLDGNNTEVVVHPPYGVEPIGHVDEIAVDTQNGHIYWGQSSGPRAVRRANLDGAGVVDLVTIGGSGTNVEGLSLDLASGKVYWCTTFPGRIYRSDLDGSNTELLVSDDAAQIAAIALALSPLDCNGNGVSDEADVIHGTSNDCSLNGVPDECEPDCNGNNVGDSCDIVRRTSSDCNGGGYGAPDECDIAGGVSQDCNANGVPDECEADCNRNALHDSCDIASATSPDCNANRIPDECDILASGPALSQPVDHCSAAQLACPGAVYEGTTFLATLDGETTCERSSLDGPQPDVWYRYVPKHDGVLTVSTCGSTGNHTLSVHNGCTGSAVNQLACAYYNCPANGRGAKVTVNVLGGAIYWIRIALLRGAHTSDFRLALTGPLCLALGDDIFDCNGNGVPDPCDIANGTLRDCNGNGLVGPTCEPDCNANGAEDSCDIADAVSLDCNRDARPDECTHPYADCNANGVSDLCDIFDGTSPDADGHEIPDECEVPVATAEGCRYIAVTPQPPDSSVAVGLKIRSPDQPCIDGEWVSRTDGQLDFFPGGFGTPADWGTALLRDSEIIPSTRYIVSTVFFPNGFAGQSVTVTTGKWGDTVGRFVNGAWTRPDGRVDIIDATAAIDRFANRPDAPPLPWVDIYPEVPDGRADIIDVVYVLEAFRGRPYPFPPPCP